MIFFPDAGFPSETCFCLRPLLYGVAELSWASQLFIHSQLQNEANRLREKQKVSSARGNSLAGSHFCDCRVIILAGPTFLHKKHFGSPNGVKSIRAIRACARSLDNQSMPEGWTFFSYKLSLKLTRLAKGDTLSQDNFSPCKRGLSSINGPLRLVF